jgi:hypothetical protein
MNENIIFNLEGYIPSNTSQNNNMGNTGLNLKIGVPKS